eukprot:8690609-Alexandrium_andersonii.AAC.1
MEPEPSATMRLPVLAPASRPQGGRSIAFPLTADVGRPVGVAVPCPVGALWRVRPVGSCGAAGHEGPRAGPAAPRAS